jgi:hypothetical protein
MAAVTTTHARRTRNDGDENDEQSTLGRPDPGHGTIVGTRIFGEER